MYISESTTPLALKYVLIFIFGLLLMGSARAQFGRFPDNGESGIVGAVPNSYVVGWRMLADVKGYEYVLSDNPQCFEGCSGDTRQKFVRDTFAIEFNLAPQKLYYWILRVYYQNGDTSQWSLIYSFTTQVTDYERRMVTLTPNPIENNTLRLRLDWAQNPDANTVELDLIDLHGKSVGRRDYLEVRELSRYQELAWHLPHLSAGIYLLRADVREEESLRITRYWLKVQVR